MPTSTRTTHARFYDTLRQIVIATRADRVVRPYRTLCLFAENACNFVIACRRVDVGIDPYRDFTKSPFVVRFCRCAPRGRGRTPPLRKIITSSLFTITSYLSCPAPTLRRNAGQLRTYSPSPHPSACGCHLPHTGKALGIANPPEISNLFCEGLQILS